MKAAAAVILALSLCHCATIRDLESPGPELREPEWPDTTFVLQSIECALERKYGAEFAGRVMRFELKEAAPDYPLRAVTREQEPPLVILRGDQPSAIRTPLRHEVFAHIAVCEYTRRGRTCNWNRMHSPDWLNFETELNRLAAQCRKEAQDGER